MKFLAFYLPQFHEIKENNEMWGKGFTEWTNVKNAKPLYEGHFQPVEPLDDNYYDLSNIDVMKWQVGLAKKYGIYGFCFYHYWYNGHLLLEKPIENWLKAKDIDFPFCICWANHNWTYSWVGKETTIIYKQDYSDKEEWAKHFNYLLEFFKDYRYIKKDNKPLLVIYEPYGVKEMGEMLDLWNSMAIQNGFSGIEFAFQSAYANLDKKFDDSKFAYRIEYQPQYARMMFYQKKSILFKRFLRHLNEKIFRLDWTKLRNKYKKDKLTSFDYDDVWNKILKMKPSSQKSIPGAFVNVDTTPRKHERGTISTGMTPSKLEEKLERLIVKTRDEYKKDMIFVYAWNEWAEGAYMEPDKRWGFGVLEAFRSALIKTGEEE